MNMKKKAFTGIKAAMVATLIGGFATLSSNTGCETTGDNAAAGEKSCGGDKKCGADKKDTAEKAE